MIEKIYKNKYMVVCDNCGTGQECDSWANEQLRAQVARMREVLKQARDAINGYSTCPYCWDCWGVNGHTKGCKFYEVLQNIDALIGEKEDV